MAKSPSHKLGQIAGYAMEEAFYEMLVPLAKEFGLYADRQEERKPARKGKFVQWADLNGNKHNLDFVLERGGSKSKIGVPAAFIESAWRRYTKHSVNKAGEISNALVPLRRTYVIHRPFLGAVVAGDWTSGGISQMESQGIMFYTCPCQPSLMRSPRKEWTSTLTKALHKNKWPVRLKNGNRFLQISNTM